MKLHNLALALAAVAAPVASHAAVIVLDFEKIAPYPSNNNVLIQNFYNGGTSSNGSSGTNFGVSFSANSLAICLNSLTVTCSNTSRGGLAPASAEGGLFFLQGNESFMDVAAGFTTGFAFNYVAQNQAGSVSVYSGLGGTGAVLATILLPTNAGSCPGYGAGFCPFSPVGVTFAGTAQSVSFAGVADQIVIDDITFGSEIVGGAVPEPATWAMMLAGFGAVGATMRYRRRKINVTYA